MHALTQLDKDNKDRSNTRFNILTPEEVEWIGRIIMDDLDETYKEPAKHTS